MLAGLFSEAVYSHVEVLLQMQLPELLALQLCLVKWGYSPTSINSRHEE